MFGAFMGLGIGLLSQVLGGSGSEDSEAGNSGEAKPSLIDLLTMRPLDAVKKAAETLSPN